MCTGMRNRQGGPVSKAAQVLDDTPELLHTSQAHRVYTNYTKNYIAAVDTQGPSCCISPCCAEKEG